MALRIKSPSWCDASALGDEVAEEPQFPNTRNRLIFGRVPPDASVQLLELEFQQVAPLADALDSALIEKVGFAMDSPVEGDGFEPSVPRQIFLAARRSPRNLRSAI